MQQHAQASVSEEDQAQSSGLDGPAYDGWVNATGAPVVKGYYVPDLRELDLGLWAERECRAAFLQLSGQEGISESRVTEIAPGKTLPPVLFALDEAVYVVDGPRLAMFGSRKTAPRGRSSGRSTAYSCCPAAVVTSCRTPAEPSARCSSTTTTSPPLWT